MSAVARPAELPLRLGFVGLGWIGRRRLDAIAPRADVEIAALVDNDEERCASAAASYPQASAGTGLSHAFGCDLDGVVIATPNGAHATQAIECLRRGLPVFCQKPLAIDAGETSRVLDAARSADRLLGIDLCYRHLEGMPELRQRIADGDLGCVLFMDLSFHNAYGPDKRWCLDRRQSGGGCVLDLGIHLLDLAAWLQPGLSMRVVSSRLWAQGRRLDVSAGEVEDLATATLERSDGARLRLSCSWHAPIGCDAIIEARIIGTAGGAHWHNLGGSFHDFEVDLCHGATRQRLGGAPDDWGARALGAWLDRLRTDRSFDPELLQLADTARLIDEVYRR